MRLIRSVNSEVFEVDFGDFLLQVPIFFNGSTKFWGFDRDLIRLLFVFFFFFSLNVILFIGGVS